MKLRICIRNVCILERIKYQIFRDSESVSSKGIYEPIHDNIKKYACILLQYTVFMTYIGFIFDQIWCISIKPRICIRNVRILERIKIRYFGILDLFSQWQYKVPLTKDLPDMPSDALGNLQTQLQGLKMLVIDEISMAADSLVSDLWSPFRASCPWAPY